MTGPDDDKTLEPVEVPNQPNQPEEPAVLRIADTDIDELTAGIGVDKSVDTVSETIAADAKGVVEQDDDVETPIEKQKYLLSPAGLAALDGNYLVLDSNLHEWHGGSEKACQFLFPDLFTLKGLSVDERQQLLKQALQENGLVTPTLFRQTVLEDVLNGRSDFTTYFSEVNLPGTDGKTTLMRGSACRLDEYDGKKNVLLIHWKPPTNLEALSYRNNKGDIKKLSEVEAAIAMDERERFNASKGMQLILDVQTRRWIGVNDETCKFILDNKDYKSVGDIRGEMTAEGGFDKRINMSQQVEARRDAALKKTMGGKMTPYMLDPLTLSGDQRWVKVVNKPTVESGRFVVEQTWTDMTETLRVTDALLKDFFEKDKHNPTLLVSVDGKTIVERNAPAGLIVDDIEDSQGTEVVSMADFLQSAEGMQVIDRVLDEMKRNIRENVDRDQAIHIPGTNWKLVSQITIPHPSGVDVVPLKLIEEKKE